LIGLFKIVAQKKVGCVVGIDCRPVVGKLRVGKLIDFSVACAADESVAEKNLRSAIGAFGERARIRRSFTR
jgi:hypothetical protein